MIIEGERRVKLLKLASLANFIDDLPHNRFHMPNWTSSDKTKESCGTAGCACGWAATVFHKEGWTIDKYGIPSLLDPIFRLQDTFHLGNTAVHAFSFFFGINYAESHYITCYLNHESKSKVGLYVEMNIIDSESAKWLSTHDDYCTKYGLENAKQITPRHAADRIREVLREIDPTLLEEQAPKIEYKPCALEGA